MQRVVWTIAFLGLFGCASALADTILYDNTLKPTYDTVLYSVGPYLALGDQVQLISPGVADQAKIELFNNGGAGTFDVDLDLFQVDSPVGALIGSAALTGIATTGRDVLDLTFPLANFAVPQNFIFTVSVANQNPVNPSVPLDLGVDMFEPPDIGTSDNGFMIAENTAMQFLQLATNSENVYFQISGTPSTAVPEPSCGTMVTLGILVWRCRGLRRRAG